MDLTDALASIAPQLAYRASTQRGAFTNEQAREAGYTQHEIQRLRTMRRHPQQWLSTRRGVYVIKSWYDALPAVEAHRVRIGALQLVLRQPAVHSHVSAAVEHGLDMLDPDLGLLHVTRGDLRGSRLEAGVLHHAAELPDEHVQRRAGDPDVTCPARTAVDIARETDRLEAAVATCDSALRLGLSPDELTAMMVRCRNWPGARLASRAVTMADGRAANAGESWSRVVLIAHGHPPTDLQTPFYDDEGLIGFADFYWEFERTIGELDGKWKYVVPEGASSEEAGRILWLEKRREDRLRALGCEVVRWGIGDLYRPQLLIARVGAARTRGQRRIRRSG